MEFLGIVLTFITLGSMAITGLYLFVAGFSYTFLKLSVFVNSLFTK
ncbi:MAG: hypothetical protein KQ78_01776 [Candidatus Izimaplasma bacterium HR2]|nr:MAG: hypothetical protein KQ78_01776 [Candidatus Izimaplasma bacterium HR2]